MSTVEDHNPFAPPQAVVADVPERYGPGQVVLASRSARLRASFVDCALYLAIGLAIGMLLALAHVGNSRYWQWVALVPILLVEGWMLYHWGQSVGKRVVGLRIVRKDGRRVGFARVFFARMCVPMAIGALPIAGPPLVLIDVLLIFRASRRCLHDDLADTIVVTAASSQDATLAGEQAGRTGPALAT